MNTCVEFGLVLYNLIKRRVQYGLVQYNQIIRRVQYGLVQYNLILRRVHYGLVQYNLILRRVLQYIMVQYKPKNKNGLPRIVMSTIILLYLESWSIQHKVSQQP